MAKLSVTVDEFGSARFLLTSISTLFLLLTLVIAMGLKLRRFRHRMSLQPLPGLGSLRGSIQARTDPDHQPAEANEEGSFFGRYRRMEDGFEPEPSERKPVSNVGIPAYVMVRKPKLDLHLPSVMKKMYGNRSRDGAMRNESSDNDVNDNFTEVNFRKNQETFDQLGTTNEITTDNAKPAKKSRKSNKKSGELGSNVGENKPKKKLSLNFRNKTRSPEINTPPVVKSVLEYDIDDDPAYQRISNIPDNFDVQQIPDSDNTEEVQIRVKSKESVNRVEDISDEYDLDNDPIYREVLQNVTRVEIRPDSLPSQEAEELPSSNRSSVEKHHVTIKALPEFDIDEYENYTENTDLQQDLEPQYSEVTSKTKLKRSSFTGSLGYDHELSQSIEKKKDGSHWYNEKFIRNGTDDVEYLELPPDNGQNDYVMNSSGYAREWYEDEESEKGSNILRLEQDRSRDSSGSEKDISKVDSQGNSIKRTDDVEVHAKALQIRDFKLQIYPIDNIEEDWGYHGSNDPSFNENDSNQRSVYCEQNEDIEDQNEVVKRTRQRDRPSITKTVTFKTPSEPTSSSRTSVASEDMFDAWEMVEECERNLRIREDKEFEFHEEEDIEGDNEEEYPPVFYMQPPVPSPRLSIQPKVKHIIGNPETTVKYNAVVTELKKSRSFSDTSA